MTIHRLITDPRHKGVAFDAFGLTAGQWSAVDAVESLTPSAITNISVLIEAYHTSLSVYGKS